MLGFAGFARPLEGVTSTSMNIEQLGEVVDDGRSDEAPQRLPALHGLTLSMSIHRVTHGPEAIFALFVLGDRAEGLHGSLDRHLVVSELRKDARECQRDGVPARLRVAGRELHDGSDQPTAPLELSPGRGRRVAVALEFQPLAVGVQ